MFYLFNVKKAKNNSDVADYSILYHAKLKLEWFGYIWISMV